MPSQGEALVIEEESEGRSSFLENLLTVEGLFMMGLAVVVDIVEIILDVLVVTEGISIALDIVAFAVIGLWMFSRSGEVTVSKKSAQRVQKLLKESEKLQQVIVKAGKWAQKLKWIRPLLVFIEMIPFVGMVPCWILAVYLELKHGGRSG